MAPQYTGPNVTGLGRLLDITKITVRSKKGPVIPAFFTFNRMTQRFEMWGSPSYPQDLPFLADNPNGPANNSVPTRSLPGPNASPQDFTDPWYMHIPTIDQVITGQNGGVDPEAFPDFNPDTIPWEEFGPPSPERVPLDPSRPYTDTWPWWQPRGYHIYYSGNKLDDAMENPDPGKGNLGLRVGPFIGPNWHWGDSEGGRNELYLGCQIPQIGQRHGGIPEPYWDLAGRVGYRYHPPEGQMCGWGWGIGTYFQWTNDQDVNDQSNPWGETIGPHHLDPYVEIHTEWDWGDYFGLPGEGSGADYHISIELGYDGDIRGGVTVGF